jgi:hypothetical protein
VSISCTLGNAEAPQIWLWWKCARTSQEPVLDKKPWNGSCCVVILCDIVNCWGAGSNPGAARGI